VFTPGPDGRMAFVQTLFWTFPRVGDPP
jgi:hypothetical protein